MVREKQRLCIARAVLKKPKVLILDDATSAVDTATEAKIRSRLAKELPDLTKIIIAQRISSVRHADQIIILDDGKIKGMGTRGSCWQKTGFIRKFIRLRRKGSICNGQIYWI